MSLYVNEALPFPPLASSASSGERASAAAAQHAAAAAAETAGAAAQGVQETAAADSADAASAAASDPMQDIIKKAVQSQVAALSEVTAPPRLLARSRLFA